MEPLTRRKGNMQTKIELIDGTVIVQGPFSAINNEIYRSLGGKFSEGAWHLPDNDTTRTKVVDLFGTKSEEIEALVPASAVGDGQIVQVGGYVLASRRGRDWRVQLADGVSLAAGQFSSSGGSMKSPRVNVSSEIVFRLRCRKSFAESRGLVLAQDTAEKVSAITI